MPSSLNKYIKRRILTRGYFQAQSEYPALNKRSTYFGLPGFIRKFEKEFEKSFNENYSETDLQEVYDIDEIVSWHNILFGLPFVDDYKITPNYFQIQPNDYFILKGFLSFDTYLLPIIFNNYFSSLDDQEKMIFLVVHKELKRNNYEDATISISDLEESLPLAKLYDFHTRKMIGNYYIFTPEVPEHFYDIYTENLADLIPNLYMPLPRHLFSFSTDAELGIIVDSLNIGDICTRLSITEEQAATMIWRYLKNGLLRLRKI